MALPEGFLEDLKFRNPIEDVISSYVSLKRAGSNLVGLCPFHNEKSPSFTVFPATKSFYCFGCGAGGDVITFTMKAENIGYADALGAISERHIFSGSREEVREKAAIAALQLVLNHNK